MVDAHYLCVGMRFVRYLYLRHPVVILYVSVLSCEQSTTGHVTVKTDKYRMLNGQGTHIYFVHFLYSYIRFVDCTAVTRTAMSVS